MDVLHKTEDELNKNLKYKPDTPEFSLENLWGNHRVSFAEQELESGHSRHHRSHHRPNSSKHGT